MTTTIAEVEKRYGLHITPDTQVELDEQADPVVVKISLPPTSKEPKQKSTGMSLRETFEEIRRLGEDEESLGTTNWAEEFKQSKIIQD